MDFTPGELYHVYNRGNNKGKIFFCDENYRFFLRKIEANLLKYCDVIAYCLMPNHYHLLIYVKTEAVGSMNPLSRKIGTLQSSYIQAINKQEDRTGSLFQQKAKSKNVLDYGLTCFHYIHQNPVRAKLTFELDEWKYSSYRSYLSHEKNGLVNKELALQLLEIPEEVDLFRSESNAMVEIDHLSYIL